MADQRHRRQVVRQAGVNWYNLRLEPASPDRGPTARIDLFDEIGLFGVSAKDFAEELNALTVDHIDLHLNSPGGEVFDALAILNTLRNHPAHVTITVDGVAASSASFIAMAGDEVVMAPNSELMIHDAWGMSIGNAADLRGLADRLDKVSDNIASVYAGRAGGTVNAWRKIMQAETWYSAKEAVDSGLADRVADMPARKKMSGTRARFDLSIYNYAGRASAPAPRSTKELNVATPTAPTPIPAAAGNPSPPTPSGSVVTPAASAVGAPSNQEGAGQMTFDPAKLREALGLDPETSDEEVRAAVVASGFASISPIGGGAPDPKNASKAPLLPGPGVAMVDQSILDQLHKDAGAGQEAFARLIRQERDQTIAAAINDGKFSPARREHWEKSWDRDPEGTKNAIAGLSKGLIPVTPAGYTTDPGGKDVEDELYASMFGEGGGR